MTWFGSIRSGWTRPDAIGVVPIPGRERPLLACCRSRSARGQIWPHSWSILLHDEYVVIELRQPLPALYGLFEMTLGIAYEGFDLGPKEARISLGQVGWACIAQFHVDPRFGELIIECIDLARI